MHGSCPSNPASEQVAAVLARGGAGTGAQWKHRPWGNRQNWEVNRESCPAALLWAHPPKSWIRDVRSQTAPSTCSPRKLGRKERHVGPGFGEISSLIKRAQKSKRCLQNKAHTLPVTRVLQAGINVMIVTAENKFSYVWQLPENIGRGQGVCTAQQHLCELISHIADGKPAADGDSRRWPVWSRRTWRRLGRKSTSSLWQPPVISQKCQMHGRWGTGWIFNIFSSPHYLLWAPA